MAVSFPIPTDQKTLKEFIQRRHPEYHDLLDHWEFCEQTYEGGRAWFKSNIFRYMKEGDQEHADRLKRAYRFNHTKEVVDLVNKYIFKSKVIRNLDDAPEEIQTFWKSASKSGLPIDPFMTLVSQQTSIFGRIWIFVDNNAETEIVTVADQKKSDARVYSYIVKPQDVLDLAYDGLGKLLWMLIRENHRDDQQPFTASGFVEPLYRLWTRDGWALFRVDQQGKQKFVVKLLSTGPNPLGEIPCFPADHIHDDDPYSANALINDIAYLDRAAGNYLSNLDAIIQDQTFSQLAMPAQATLPGEDKFDKLLELGTKRIFIFDGEGGTAPMFLSPDVKQAQVIVDVVNKIIGEIYHTVGMAGERTKQDNTVGIYNSSGVAKAFDFDRLNSLLCAKADTLEAVEGQLCRLVMKWYGKDYEPNEEDDKLIKYPDTFDVRALYDEFDVATRLTLIDAPETVRQEQMQQLVDKLFPRLKQALRDQMRTDIQNNWPPDPLEMAGGAGAKPNTLTLKELGGGRQGQVTGQEQKTV